MVHARVEQIVTLHWSGVREAEAGAPAITQLSTVMVPTCGSDGARQSRVQQPQQLGAPTVDATECGC